MKTLVKNPYRFTAKMTPSEMIEIHGKQFITAEEWCKREVKRLTDNGIDANIVRQGNSLIWCCRSRAGVTATSDADEAVTA